MEKVELKKIFHSALIFIESKTQSLINLNENIKSAFDFVDSYENPLMLLVICFSIFMILKFLINNRKAILTLSTYTKFFVNLLKSTSFFKSKMEKERRDLIKFASESMGVNLIKKEFVIEENKRSVDSFLNYLDEISVVDKTEKINISKRTGCSYIHDSSLRKNIDDLCGEIHQIYDYTELSSTPSAKIIDENFGKIVLNLFNAPEDAGYLSTFGGTESILSAMLMARNCAYDKGIKNPEVIVNTATHPAFDKGASIFNIVLKKAVLSSNYNVDTRNVESLINENTIMIVSNNINYPYGVDDDIETLSKISQKYGLLLHVDACMGGFMTCFMTNKSKRIVEISDFRIKGVTSISADAHKYGLTPKGISHLLVRDKNMLTKISYGHIGSDGLKVYNSLFEPRNPSYLISGFLILIHKGKSFYYNQAERISNVVYNVTNEIRKKYKDLEVLGQPRVSIFTFKGKKSAKIHYEMKQLGWNMNLLQNPICCMFCITSANLEEFENGRFLNDLDTAYQKIGTVSGKEDNLAAVYGISALLPEDIVNANMDVALNCFLDSKSFIESTLSIDKDDKRVNKETKDLKDQSSLSKKKNK